MNRGAPSDQDSNTMVVDDTSLLYVCSSIIKAVLNTEVTPPSPPPLSPPSPQHTRLAQLTRLTQPRRSIDRSASPGEIRDAELFDNLNRYRMDYRRHRMGASRGVKGDITVLAMGSKAANGGKGRSIGQNRKSLKVGSPLHRIIIHHTPYVRDLSNVEHRR